MKSGEQINEFNSLLGKRIREQIEVQTAWVIVKEVNWQDKSMTVTSVADNLDYYEVLLGIGSEMKKPKLGTRALIGIIGNNQGNSFLITADEIEEINIISEESEFTIKETGFIVKKGSESLKEVLNDMIDEINKIIVINGTTINVPAMTVIKQRLNTILIE